MLADFLNQVHWVSSQPKDGIGQEELWRFDLSCGLANSFMINPP